MSKIALVGNTSGNGVFTIVSPNGNTDRILTLPDAAGNVITTGSSGAVTQGMLAAGVVGNGPAFSASGSGTVISNSTYTKILFSTENFDTAGVFDMATGRFTPQVTGYYQFNFIIGTNQGSGGLFLDIRKNGTRFSISSATPLVASIGAVCAGSALVFLNGTTDYVELFCYQTSGISVTATSDTGISGFLARAA